MAYTEDKPKKKKSRFLRFIIFVGIIYGIYYGISHNYIDLDAIAKQIDIDAIKKVATNIVSPTPSMDVYGSKATKMDYRKAMFNEYTKDSLVIFEGQVRQILEETTLLIATKKFSSTDLYLEDNVVAKFDTRPEVLDGDIVKIYARYNGTKKLQMLFTGEQQYPYLQGDYLTITVAR